MPRPPHCGARIGCAFVAVVLTSLAGRAARAQDAGVVTGTESAGETESARLRERIDAIEARSAALSTELDEARARVGVLEEERARDDAAEAAEAEAEVAEAEAEAAEEASAGPTLHPLANLVTRFEHREGYDALGSPRALQGVGCFGGSGPGVTLADSDCIRYRARVGFEIRDIALGSDAVAIVRFLPQVAGFWAMPAITFGGPGSGSSSGGTVDALLGIHEASLILQLSSWARFEIGRFEMSYGDVAVIGNLDWHPNGRAFDGARVRITPEANSYWIDAFFTLVNEGHAVSLTGAPAGGGFGQADQYFYGLYAGLGSLLDALPTTALDVYALVLQTNNRFAGMAPLETEWSLRATIGSRFRYRFDMVDVRAEGAVQVGREGGSRTLPTDPFSPQQEVVAGFFLGEVGFNVLDNQLRFALEGNFASGNDPTTTNANESYAHLFPTAHAFLGYTDVMGARSNVSSAVLHVSARPVAELAIHLDVHSFVVPERGATATTNYAGTEGNLNLVWTPLTGLRLRAMYGAFFPETAFWRLPTAPIYTSDPVHYLEVELGFVLR